MLLASRPTAVPAASAEAAVAVLITVCVYTTITVENALVGEV
ncbi:hypothetical protein [Pyrobaculum ferrireducens]|nr:hypothetical protein [Pyrobaculum ferrireducens]